MFSRKRYLYWLHTFLVLLIWIFLPALSIAAVSDPNQIEASLLDELHTVVQTLRQERTAFYEAQRQIENHIQQKRTDLAALETKVAVLRSQEEQVDRDLTRIEQDVELLELELQSQKIVQAQQKQAMNAWMEQARKTVNEGIPFRQQERCERFMQIEPEPSELSSVSTADTLGRIWSFFQEEMRLARSGETITRQIETADNRVQYAQLFRVGHLVLGYLTEDGQQTGLWLEQNGQKQWQHALTKDDAKASRTAVKILDRRQGPGLLSLPISIRIERTSQKKELDKTKTPNQ